MSIITPSTKHRAGDGCAGSVSPGSANTEDINTDGRIAAHGSSAELNVLQQDLNTCGFVEYIPRDAAYLACAIKVQFL